MDKARVNDAQIAALTICVKRLTDENTLLKEELAITKKIIALQTESLTDIRYTVTQPLPEEIDVLQTLETYYGDMLNGFITEMRENIISKAANDITNDEYHARIATLKSQMKETQEARRDEMNQ